MRKIFVLVVAGLLAALSVAALSFGGTNAATVKVTLKEWKLVRAPATVPAGKVTFAVMNMGKLRHEMVVMRTPLAAAKLPTTTKGRVPEKGVVGEVHPLAPGASGKVTIALTSGHYALFCNLIGHYKAGQFADLNVK